MEKEIEAFFRSSDRELMKLGQRLCHTHRINYYVICRVYYNARIYTYKGTTINSGRRARHKECIYTLDKEVSKELSSLNYFSLGGGGISNGIVSSSRYKIILNKNFKIEKKLPKKQYKPYVSKCNRTATTKYRRAVPNSRPRLH